MQTNKKKGFFKKNTYLVKGKTFSKHKVLSSVPRAVEEEKVTQGTRERKRIEASKGRERKRGRRGEEVKNGCSKQSRKV